MDNPNVISCSYCQNIPEEYLEMDCTHNICMKCAKNQMDKVKNIILCIICKTSTKLEEETVEHINNFKINENKNYLQKIEEEIEEEKELLNSDIFDKKDSSRNNLNKISEDRSNNKIVKKEKNNKKIKKKKKISSKWIKSKSKELVKKKSLNTKKLNDSSKKKITNPKQNNKITIEEKFNMNMPNFPKMDYLTPNIIDNNLIESYDEPIKENDDHKYLENESIIKKFISKEKEWINSKPLIENNLRKNFIYHKNKFKNFYNNILNYLKKLEIKYKSLIKDNYEIKWNHLNRIINDSKSNILKYENLININILKDIEPKSCKNDIYLLQSDHSEINKDIFDKIKNFENYFKENFEIETNNINLNEVEKHKDSISFKSVLSDFNKTTNEFKNYKNSFFKEKIDFNSSIRSRNSFSSKKSINYKILDKDMNNSSLLNKKFNLLKNDEPKSNDNHISNLLKLQMKSFNEEISKLK